MNNKQLAEMVKMLRKKKLAEVIGKSSPFDPMHHKATHKEDPQSPNQYVHEEEKLDEDLGSTYHRRSRNIYKGTVGALEKRRKWQLDGQQSMRGGRRYTYSEQDDVELGSTDTGKKGKDAETITVNPKDNTASAKGSTDKNTTIKEIKEK